MKLIRFALAALAALPLLSGAPSQPDNNEKRVGCLAILTATFPLRAFSTAYDYDSWNLNGSELSREAFDAAVKGYSYFMEKDRLAGCSGRVT